MFCSAKEEEIYETRLNEEKGGKRLRAFANQPYKATSAAGSNPASKCCGNAQTRQTGSVSFSPPRRRVFDYGGVALPINQQAPSSSTA